MTFVARQRRALSEIEYMLRRTDTCLASKFRMFSRLADDEAMPSAERAIPGSARRRGGMTRIGQLPCRLPALLCVAAVIAAAIVTGLLAGAGSHARCGPARGAPLYSLQVYSLQSSNFIQCNQEVRQHARRTRPGRLRGAEGHDPVPGSVVLNQPRADRTLPPAIVRPTTASEGAAK